MICQAKNCDQVAVIVAEDMDRTLALCYDCYDYLGPFDGSAHL